ncbi:hypothetical protein K9L27_04670 [Candidatus Gracilibacteria bacterium]|nr:hypothetical protein [Candidatus Gracilibacteria bacterium]
MSSKDDKKNQQNKNEVLSEQKELKEQNKEQIERKEMNNFVKKEYVGSELEDLSEKQNQNEKKEEKKSSGAFGDGAEALGFGKRQATLIEEGMETFQDDKKLTNAMKMWEEAEKNKKWLLWLSGEKMESPREGIVHNVGTLVEKVADKYVKEGVDEKTGEKKLVIKDFEEVIGESSDGNILKKFWLIITHPIEFVKYQFAKSKKEVFFKGKDLATLEKNIEDIKQEAEIRIGQAENIIDDSKGTIRRVLKTRAEQKIEQEIARKTVEKKMFELNNLKGKFEGEAMELKNKFAKIGPEKFAPEMKELLSKYGDEFAKHGPAGARFLERNKKLGFGVKGGMVFVGYSTIKELFFSWKDGNWDGFKETMKDSSWWSDVFESLPIWGSIKSFERLDDYSSDLPTWARWTMFGVNAGLDAVAIIPFIVGTFAGVAPGAAVAGARAGLGRLASVGIKGAAKWFTKEGGELLVKEGVEIGAKKVGKEAAEELVEKGTKEVLEGGTEMVAKKTAVKVTAESLGKSLLGKMTKFNWKEQWSSLWRLIIKQSQWQLAAETAMWSWETFGPSKGEVMEFAVKNTLSDTQQKFVQKTKILEKI